MGKRLSDNFTWAEALVSDTAKSRGISNIPEDGDISAIQHTADQMEKVRQILGNNPIKVNSWYRNDEVNRLVGGTHNSAHRRGYAVDFTCSKFGNPKEICEAISSSGLTYDQLIWEYGRWVHISFAPTSRYQDLWILDKKDGYRLGTSPK